MKTQSKLKIIKVLNNNKIELINFNNVARINIQYTDRIVLNFNHIITRNVKNKHESIQYSDYHSHEERQSREYGLKTDTKLKTFSGYYYIDKNTVSNYDSIMKMLFSEEFLKTFIKIMSRGECVGFVNVNELSTIKVSDYNLSVIFNMSHSINNQRSDGSDLLSADSVISTFVNLNDFEEYVDDFLESHT